MKKVAFVYKTGTKNHGAVKKVDANNVKDEHAGQKPVRHKSFYIIGTHSKDIYVARAEMRIQVKGNPALLFKLLSGFIVTFFTLHFSHVWRPRLLSAPQCPASAS